MLRANTRRRCWPMRLRGCWCSSEQYGTESRGEGCSRFRVFLLYRDRVAPPLATGLCVWKEQRSKRAGKGERTPQDETGCRGQFSPTPRNDDAWLHYQANRKPGERTGRRHPPPRGCDIPHCNFPAPMHASHTRSHFFFSLFFRCLSLTAFHSCRFF